MCFQGSLPTNKPGCRDRTALSLHPVLGAGSLSQNQSAPGSEHPASRKSILSAMQTSEQIKTPSYSKFRLAHWRFFFAPLSWELLLPITTSSLIYVLFFECLLIPASLLVSLPGLLST